MPACGTDMDDEYGCTLLLVPVYDNGTAIRREGQVDVVESAGCAWETRSDRPWAPMLPSETDGLVRDTRTSRSSRMNRIAKRIAARV